MNANSMEPGVFNYTTEDEERILSGVMGDAAFLTTPSIIEMKKKRYENDSRRLITLQLHLTTLGQYYKEHKIPRGLRSNIRPNLFLDNPIFCTRFTMISNKYAMDVMLLNIEFLQGDIKKLQQNIAEGEVKIKENLKIEEWTVFKEKIDKDMYKFRGDLEETKRKKWSRDNGDYETGQTIQVDGRRKRRGGKRHYRSQKENRKKQTTTTSTETTEPQETRTELVVNISLRN
ncbi:unnamed protein product [Ranitomeya imitator]|uniref:Uncharacterized protein n=1 Tax=Ranitomeya imitator TaxID=111125 RepID=A0ABN9MA74_9NEOB|nr:unnamed protein product [Ranitomeya imitator]